ncbi:barstar family protein [Fusobacterium sp. PH5-44]|uniref:barstar family protein n=1 Tax=unclassified Fusobacterium TaxID=2648384 RepID=UPI003D1E0509
MQISSIVAIKTRVLPNVLNLANNNCLKVEIDGRSIKYWKDYGKKIANLLDFPEGDRYINYDAFLDWMTDLKWISQRNIIIIINNYDELLEDDLKEKENFLDIMRIIIEYWNGELFNNTGAHKILTFYLVTE